MLCAHMTHHMTARHITWQHMTYHMTHHNTSHDTSHDSTWHITWQHMTHHMTHHRHHMTAHDTSHDTSHGSTWHSNPGNHRKHDILQQPITFEKKASVCTLWNTSQPTLTPGSTLQPSSHIRTVWELAYSQSHGGRTNCAKSTPGAALNCRAGFHMIMLLERWFSVNICCQHKCSMM